MGKLENKRIRLATLNTFLIPPFTTHYDIFGVKFTFSLCILQVVSLKKEDRV
jgi:hypothetical protein